MKSSPLWRPALLAYVSSCFAATHNVQVGLNHEYNPNVVNASVGDTILFTFYPTNHSVVRAAYGQPCIPYNYVFAGEPTFFSGNELSSAGDDAPTWELTVNSTEPDFFYCAAPGSCINELMIGAINPNATHTIDAQIAAGKKVDFQLSPGEPFPSEETTAPTPTSTPTPSSQPSDAPQNSGGESGGSSLSSGAIAGIAIGAAAVILIAIALVYFCGRKGGIEKGYRRSRTQSVGPPAMVEANYAEHGMGPDDASKSPIPNATSPYPVPSHASTYRSTSPAQWSSSVGSPHGSWLGHPGSGVLSQHGFEVPAPVMETQELSASPHDPNYPHVNAINYYQAPAELPGDHATRHEAQ